MTQDRSLPLLRPCPQYLCWEVLFQTPLSASGGTPHVQGNASVPGFNPGAFHIQGERGSCCSHTQQSSKQIPSTSEPDNKKRILVSMATCLKLFPIEKNLQRRTSEGNHRAVAPEEPTSCPQLGMSEGFHAACSTAERSLSWHRSHTQIKSKSSFIQALSVQVKDKNAKN